MRKKIKKPVVLAFGKRLRMLRERRKLTQEELGFRCDLDRTFIGFIERAERSITLETMSKLAKGLNLGLEALVRGL